MPQSMLALLALAIFTQLTFSQQQVTVKSYERLLRDELSVAASGMMMEVMELMSARPFDASSTPDAVLSNGLPAVSEFTGIGPGGSDTGCTPLNIDIGACNDLDDLDIDRYPNDAARSDEAWFPVELELSNGGVLPFEVKIDVSYVDGEFPDVNVSGPTGTKRVDLLVRTPFLFDNRPFVHLERVIAYDPFKAAADCQQAHAGHSNVNNCSLSSDLVN
jgi:hypothetical protein